MKKKTLAKPKVGQFVRVRHKKYRTDYSQGVVTESFSDMFQVFGADGDELGFTEYDLDEYEFSTLEHEKVKFVVTQALRKLEAKVLSAKTKHAELEEKLSESRVSAANLILAVT